MDMRSYIDSLKKYENGSPEMKEWIEWATSATNWYDPLVKFDHPYLKDVDRDTLSIKTLDSEIENWYNSYNTHDYGEDNEWDLNMEFMTEY